MQCDVYEDESIWHEIVVLDVNSVGCDQELCCYAPDVYHAVRKMYVREARAVGGRVQGCICM